MKKLQDLYDIPTSRSHKTLIELFGWSCSKSCIQFNKLSIKFLINFVIWFWFFVTSPQVHICESSPAFLSYVFMIVDVFKVVNLEYFLIIRWKTFILKPLWYPILLSSKDNKTAVENFSFQALYQYQPIFHKLSHRLHLSVSIDSSSLQDNNQHIRHLRSLLISSNNPSILQNSVQRLSKSCLQGHSIVSSFFRQQALLWNDLLILNSSRLKPHL